MLVVLSEHIRDSLRLSQVHQGQPERLGVRNPSTEPKLK
ncbi:hypothetical protein TRICHSKD4_3437 [Roseibium sp. TrichSKD4]|nr:hypothetical protein TRICHSKD4_3437 [Roseibium sp. TrichSKD4]